MAQSDRHNEGGMPRPREEGTPKLKVPEGNESVTQKAAAPLATVSSHADPWPHCCAMLMWPAAIQAAYCADIMAGACGGAAYHSYANLNNPRAAAIKLAFGAVYAWAGRMLVSGNPKLGYDLGTVNSLALLAFTGASSAFSRVLLPVAAASPKAYGTSEAASTVMASLAGISGLTNLIKSYQQRTGKPKELGYTRE